MSAYVKDNRLIIDLSPSEIVLDNRLVTNNGERDQCNIVLNPDNMNFVNGFSDSNTYFFDVEKLEVYKKMLMKLKPLICDKFKNKMKSFEYDCDVLKNRTMGKLTRISAQNRAFTFDRSIDRGYNDSDQQAYRKILYEDISSLVIEKIKDNDYSVYPIYRGYYDYNSIVNNKNDEILDQNNNSEESSMINCLEINRKPREITKNNNPLNLIVYGAPGTSKTYQMPLFACNIIENHPFDYKKSDIDINRKEIMMKYQNFVREGRIVFTTFHQNYGYEDFIQGLRPDPNAENLSFKTIDGTFKRIADKAMLDENNPYIIIIDEINRGNISKIFGELITLIEEDKRWGEENQMSVKLLSGEDFAVPNNLYIIGTMNSADKSISLIDTALRRRFAFEEMTPNPNLITNDNLKSILIKLNEELQTQLESTDLLIGHSYFINKKEDDLVNIFNRHIIPLLYEYFYDNRKKVELMLNNVLKGTNVEINNNEFGRLTIKKKS